MSSSSTAASITSLLDSLHTYLQSQTQLLPTLHSQLGLPASALEDDLRGLQRELLSSVEIQVDKRRKEVEQWMEKCAKVEKQCVRYTKALGGNIKATGTSVGELRKERSLPRRYEMVSEYQEKLRQVYHTKLEQLNALTNRLSAIARTLGAEYFALDMTEPTLAFGESPTDPAVCRDVTPERFLKLEKELVRGKTEVNKRLHQLSTTFIQIDWLYSELGISPPGLDDLPLSPSFGVATSGCQSVASSSTASCSHDPFVTSTPTPSSRASSATLLFKGDVISGYDHQQTFAKFALKLEEGDFPENQSTPVGLENVDPTPGLLQWASSLLASLEDTKRRREAHIQAMYDQLEGLWRRMGVSDADMDAFVENHKGSTEEMIREYEDELERMLELKRERMGMFVENAREEIIKLWDDLMVGEDERADFAPFADDEFTEELLTIHEDEIKRLKEERRNKAPLLASVKKYFEICVEEKELAAAASDQSRLTGRGPRDPGRLLREEKMRKRVTKEKPRLEQELLISIPTWEQEAGKPFLVHGEPFLQILMASVSAADQENKRKQPRAGSVPPRATTPVNLAHGCTPGLKASGVVTPAVRTSSQACVAGSQSLPHKRQRIGENGQNSTAFVPTARIPLGGHKGVNIVGASGRLASPTKLPVKTPSSTMMVSSGASLSRPAAIGMVMPKPGTQHHALGHGRVPTSVIYGAGVSGVPSGGYNLGASVRSVSSSLIGGGGQGRILSGIEGSHGSNFAKKSSRARRESFRPRPSMEATLDHGMSVTTAPGGKRQWDGFTVKEEEEY